MTKDEIREKYTAVEYTLDDAIKKSKSIQVIGEEENSELDTIISTLEEINSEFKSEIDKLEKSSEWDKYCVAFFGETNAGKSTVIESLRIIFDEEQRRIELARKKKEYELELQEHCNDYKKLLLRLKSVNESLSNKKVPSKFQVALKNIAFVILGIAIGVLIAFLGLL